MKILHYINNLGSGGAEKLLTDILPSMKIRGHDVYLVYSNEYNCVPQFRDSLKKEIPVINFNLSFYNPFQIFKLIRLVRKEKFDIVHAHLFPTQYWLALASYFFPRKTKLIKTEHNVFNNRRKKKFLLGLEKFVYSRYSKVIAITDEVAKELKSWLGKDENIVMIPNGVNLKQIEDVRSNARAEDYDFLKKDRFNILMVGRFSGAKDQNSLIHAVARLDTDIHLYLAGEGGGRIDSENLAKQLRVDDRVHFLGMRTDVYALMNRVDLNVLSTNYEGLSGVTLESLASGKPFVGSDVDGVNNIVPNALFLVPKNNPERLANKVLEIRNNSELKVEMVKLALEHVTKYDINFMVDNYLSEYEMMLTKM